VTLRRPTAAPRSPAPPASARPRAHAARAAALAACALAACAPAARRPPDAAPAPRPAPPFAIPFGAPGRVDTLAPGVLHAEFAVPESAAHGRWAVHVLRLGAGACVSAVKANDAAVGRATTSALVGKLAERDSAVLGAVNADFFSFTPPGARGARAPPR
jgi:hypothetical protein